MERCSLFRGSLQAFWAIRVIESCDLTGTFGHGMQDCDYLSWQFSITQCIAQIALVRLD